MHKEPDHVRELTEALGEAALACWGELPHDIQQRLFEGAAGGKEDGFRVALAHHLHKHHPRTAY